MAVNEKTLQVVPCSTFSFFSYSISLLPFPFFGTQFFFIFPVRNLSLCSTLSPCLAPISLSSQRCWEREGGCLERWLEKEQSLGSFMAKFTSSLPLPAARPNGLVQCADFCRKLLETLCVRVCVCVVQAIFFFLHAHITCCSFGLFIQLWTSDSTSSSQAIFDACVC